MWSKRIMLDSSRKVQLLQLGRTEGGIQKQSWDYGRPGWCPKVPTWTQTGKEVRSHLKWAGQEGWAQDVTQSLL